jgi:hypothetical protein
MELPITSFHGSFVSTTTVQKRLWACIESIVTFWVCRAIILIGVDKTKEASFLPVTTITTGIAARQPISFSTSSTIGKGFSAVFHGTSLWFVPIPIHSLRSAELVGAMDTCHVCVPDELPMNATLLSCATNNKSSAVLKFPAVQVFSKNNGSF